MRPFTYTVASSPADAVVRAADGARFIAGGTNLVDLMRLGVETPAALVDVTALGLDTVAASPSGGLLVGSGVRNSDLAAHDAVRVGYPVLSQALLTGASGQLRNMATVGGNLLQRTRCVYFQDVTKACNKRVPGSGCPARDGLHRDLGVIGTSASCVATHPSDMAVALAALDARVHVSGPAGDRVLALDELYRLPGTDPSRDTTLGPADLITAVELPAPSALSRTSAYRKVRDRASYAFAVGSVAAAVEVRDGVLAQVRLAFGALAPRPWRARIAEDLLHGQAPSVDAFTAAVQAELAAAEPLPHNAFKVPLAVRLATAVLRDLTDAGGAA